MQLPKTTSEQREDIYEDVRALIMPGFLAHPVEIQGTRFVLRTLDALDWRMLQYRAHGLRGRSWVSWAVASSIWMVDGTTYLNNEDALRMLVEMCQSLPMTVLEDLYGVLEALMRKVRQAAEVSEAFLYETESRQLWLGEGRGLWDRSEGRGLAWSRNAVLKLWVFYNQMEDVREHDDYLWSLAKFIAGPHVPKGIKKLNAQDKQRENDLRNRRQGVLDRIYYEAKGMIPRKKAPGTKKGRSKFQEVHMAETPEELQDEMRRWVLGIKDDHDQVVDGVKARIKHEVESRRKQEADRRTALQRALEEEGISRTQLVPLVGDAGREFIERMKARVPGVSQVHDEHGHNSAYEKYIAKNPEVGDLRVDEEGHILSSQPVGPHLLEMMRKPESGEGTPSLQSEIERRRPVATILEGEEEE